MHIHSHTNNNNKQVQHSTGVQSNFFAPAVQPKLTVNEPGDMYEQEADAMADKVMRMKDAGTGDSFFKPSPLNVQRKCQHCDEEEKKLHRKETPGESPSITPDGSNYIQSLDGKGRTLSHEERGFFEPRFGHDFANVRLHTDAAANASAQSINAQAYTYGGNIVFAQSQYQPGTDAGKRLIAHELAHTLQQGSGIARQVQRQVNQVDINCGTNQVNFSRDDGATAYDLDQCNVTDGEYEAAVTVTGANVDFTLQNAPASTQFNFHYAIGPGQPNPSTFFAGQSSVHIRCSHDAAASGAQQEIPVTFVGDEMMYISAFDTSSQGLPLGYGGMMGSAGLSTYITSLGDLGWLNQAGMSRGLAPELWRGLIPGRGLLTLDRTIDLGPDFTDLVQGLGPRIENEGPLWLGRNFPDNIPPALGGMGSPLSFTQAELDSIPGLVARFNTGGASVLSPQELLLLRRAVSIQGGMFGGSTPGSPLASYSEAGRTAPFLSGNPAPGEVRYRVRVQVDRSAAADTSRPNELTLGEEALTNVEEAEFMVVANSRRQIVSIQRIPPGGAEPGWIMRNAGALRWGGRILLVGGIALSGYRIATATPEERPRVIAEEGGGWGGGLLGTELGAGACIAFGIATEGIGLLLCGIAGGIGGGLLGSAAAGAAVDSASSGTWGSSPTHRFPDGTWYDRSGEMHMGPGPKW